MDIDKARQRKREAEEKILEALREFERDSDLAVDGLKVRTVEHTDGTTSFMNINIEVTL
jgi:hypothetical protein